MGKLSSDAPFGFELLEEVTKIGPVPVSKWSWKPRCGDLNEIVATIGTQLSTGFGGGEDVRRDEEGPRPRPF